MFSKEKNNQNSWIVYLLIILCSCQLGCSLFYKQVDVIAYRVQPGDSLSQLADRFQVSTEELIVHNNLVNPNQLQVGQSLEVPYRGQKIAKKAAPRTIVAKEKTTVKEQLGNTKFSEKRLSSAEVAHVSHHRGQLYWPVDKKLRRISSKFGWRWLKFHEGLDLAAKTGSPIYAAHAGKVLVSGYQLHGYGKMVIIQSDDLLSVYAHNSQNYVVPGENISKGEKIAAVGATGKATGPHLHFEVRVRNKEGKFVAVDPIEFLS